MTSLPHKSMHDQSHFSRFAALIVSVAVFTCLSVGVLAQRAYAEESLDELQSRVESSADAYEQAIARVEELKTLIAANEEKIAQLQVQIPSAKEKGSAAAVALYKMQNETSTMVNAILDTDNFGDFLHNLEYVQVIQTGYFTQLNTLTKMLSEVQTTQTELASQYVEAEQQAKEAQEQLAAAKAARQQAANEAAARAAAEQQEAAEALERAKGQTIQTDNPGGDTGERADEPSSGGGVDWSSDKSAFVAEWASRIDAYMGSAPLGGYGAVFAEAAWEYGIDPRYSPAISCIESGKGVACFRSHNAWGWGNSGWDSWEEAIWAHVAGLAHGYHYTVCIEDAQKYCPPTWESWYSGVLAQINKI